MGVLSPAIVLGEQLYVVDKEINLATESGTSVRWSYINLQALQKVAERIQKKNLFITPCLWGELTLKCCLLVLS